MARSALDLLCSRLPELLLVAVTGNAIFLVVFFFRLYYISSTLHGYIRFTMRTLTKTTLYWLGNITLFFCPDQIICLYT